MRSDPLTVTLLQQRAKANAKGHHTGRAIDGDIRCHYYPRSQTWGWWNETGKCRKADIVAHYRFQENFRRRA